LLPTRRFTLAALNAALAAETRRSRDRDGTAGIDRGCGKTGQTTWATRWVSRVTVETPVYRLARAC
jgi:hypothetical protein